MIPSVALMFGTKALGNFISGNKKSAENLHRRTQGLIQEESAWNQNADTNKAINEANLTNQIRTGYKVGLLNVQAAHAKKKAMQDGFDISRTRQQVLGAATANAAAAGTVGASVDAVVQDINSKVSEAQAHADVNYEQTADNFSTQLTDLIAQGQDVLRHAAKVTVQRTPEAVTYGFGEALAGAAIDAAGQYFGAQMNLGLGK